MKSNTVSRKRLAAQAPFAKLAPELTTAGTSKAAPSSAPITGQHQAEAALTAGVASCEHQHDSEGADAPRGPAAARLLSKRQVLGIVSLSYPTIWKMMRSGTFPRSRVVGGKSMWVTSEINDWIANLPKRTLKGDANGAAP